MMFEINYCCYVNIMYFQKYLFLFNKKIEINNI